MGTSTTYPNGQTLVSDALTKDQINALIQTLTCGMLGINPPDPFQVRVDWPIEGQPAQNNQTDVCYIRCTTKDNPYSRIRDRVLTQAGTGKSAVLTENWFYTRVWQIAWTFYGPNSTDRARMVWDAMFMDYFADELAAENLFPVPDMPEPIRVPENFNAQWWERADFEVEMYEGISETINDGIATSVQVTVEGDQGQLAQFTVSES